jgi:hypothetical protein
MVCERPKIIRRDEQGRLHREDGAAVSFRDGWGVHAWHGVRVPPDIIEHPELITIEQINACTNAEIRRVMIERYGQDRYLVHSGAEEISRDQFGTLYRKDIEGDESLVMVRVLNSTPEADGSLSKEEALRAFSPDTYVVGSTTMTGIPLSDYDGASRFKDYFLRVPPDIKTANQAVAWTFDLSAAEYAPEAQS